MEGVFGGVIGIIIIILVVCLAISWLIFPIWIYTLNENVKDIRELMIRREQNRATKEPS